MSTQAKNANTTKKKATENASRECRKASTKLKQCGRKTNNKSSEKAKLKNTSITSVAKTTDVISLRQNVFLIGVCNVTFYISWSSN